MGLRLRKGVGCHGGSQAMSFRATSMTLRHLRAPRSTSPQPRPLGSVLAWTALCGLDCLGEGVGCSWGVGEALQDSEL